MPTAELKNIYLVLWNLGKLDAPPSVGEVRERLAANNLNPERAADVPAASAMRRAADSLKTKTLEAKTFTSKESNRTRMQMDEVVEDNGRLRRKFVSQYELDSSDCPRHIAGDEQPEFIPAFDHAADHYTPADLSRIIQKIMVEDGLGAYSPRKGGSVYFVPVKPEAADLVQRLAQFSASVSIEFLTYTVPDTDVQRLAIANAIAAAYLEEIGVHAEAVAGYDHDTKAGVISNRRDAIAATCSQMAKLASLMNGRYASLVQECDLLRAKLGGIVNEQDRREAEAQRVANEALQRQRQAGGRRIVTGV